MAEPPCPANLTAARLPRSHRRHLGLVSDEDRFVKASELAEFNGALVDDLLDERTQLLFVGINPGLWTAAVNAHFARPGNRFWPALHLAGILPRLVDASTGMSA